MSPKKRSIDEHRNATRSAPDQTGRGNESGGSLQRGKRDLPGTPHRAIARHQWDFVHDASGGDQLIGWIRLEIEDTALSTDLERKRPGVDSSQDHPRAPVGSARRRSGHGTARCGSTGRNTRGARYGFPVGGRARAIERLLAAHRSVVVVQETSEHYTRIRHRVPVCRVVPLTG